MSDAGAKPEEVLAEEGLLLVRGSGLIDGCLNAVYTGADLKKLEPAHARQCGGAETSAAATVWAAARERKDNAQR